jgi:transposase
VAFGRPARNKPGCEAIAIGLLTNKDGCPVAVEVFRGNTADQSTVWAQAKRLAESFGIKTV